MRHTRWHGTPDESLALLGSIEDHCTCEIVEGVRRTVCPSHHMLVEDQRVLDGLLFARRYLRERLHSEEWRGSEVTARYYFTPTNRSAASIEEFLAVCQAEPDIAGAHFEHGYFEPWLRHIGRPDLAELTLRLRGAEIDRFLQAAAQQSEV